MLCNIFIPGLYLCLPNTRNICVFSWLTLCLEQFIKGIKCFRRGEGVAHEPCIERSVPVLDVLVTLFWLVGGKTDAEESREWTKDDELRLKTLYIRTEEPGMGAIDTAGVNTTLAVDVAVTDPIKSNENTFFTLRIRKKVNERTNWLSVLGARIQNSEVSP
jgi:hypothetical protein